MFFGQNDLNLENYLITDIEPSSKTIRLSEKHASITKAGKTKNFESSMEQHILYSTDAAHKSSQNKMSGARGRLHW